MQVNKTKMQMPCDTRCVSTFGTQVGWDKVALEAQLNAIGMKNCPGNSIQDYYFHSLPSSFVL